VDSFGYLSVLLSIILGLGLTQILTATGRLIRHRSRVRVHWLPLLLAGVLLQTATLYVMAAVVLSEQVDEAEGDLGEYFDRHHRWFFAFFLATLFASVAKDMVLTGHLPERANLGFHLALGVGCVAGMVIRRRRYQEALGVAFTLIIVVYIAMLFARLR
jgi:hypothetical protein